MTDQKKPVQKQPEGDTPRTPDMGVALVADVPSGTTSDPRWGGQPVPQAPSKSSKEKKTDG